MFTKKIDNTKPDLIIECSELDNPNGIYDKIKSMNAESYAYAFAYRTPGALSFTVLKYGMSCPKPAGERKNNTLGERLVRQIANIDGWNRIPASANGSDFIKGINQLKEDGIIPDYINKSHLIIGVWNTSSIFRGKCLSPTASAEIKARWVEAELCKQYKEQNSKKLPPLNKVDPSTGKRYAEVAKFAQNLEDESTMPPIGIELFEFE